MSQESQRRPNLGGSGAGSGTNDDTEANAERALMGALAELTRLGLKAARFPDPKALAGRATCPTCQAEGVLLVRWDGTSVRFKCFNHPDPCADNVPDAAVTRLRAEADQRQAAERAERERQAAERVARQEVAKAERERQAAEAMATQYARATSLPTVLQKLYGRLPTATIDADGVVTARCPVCRESTMSASVNDDGAPEVWCSGGCDDDDVCRALQLPTAADRASMLDWGSDIALPEWLIPDVVARGHFASIYGRSQSGKSLYMQEQSFRLARAGERVLYLDQENASSDVRRRFQDMGVTGQPTGLDYRCFPPVGGLDTVAGAENFVRSVRAAKAAVVFLDTWSKFVDGQEADPSTHTRAYKRSIIPLRAEGVTIIVGDHPGKDEKAGPRGGSSKGNNVDVEWWFHSKLEGAVTRVTLTNTKDRTDCYPDVVQLQRLTSPLRHEALSGTDAHPSKVAEILTALDRCEVPPGTGRPTAVALLKKGGYGFKAEDLAAALKVRNV